jgi:5-hydroxyisourate hydrolase
MAGHCINAPDESSWAMAKLSTHVLDTMSGLPAAGMTISLKRQNQDGRWQDLVEIITNQDGRTDQPLLAAHDMLVGDYELTFYVGDYFAAHNVSDAKKFLDVVPIRFRISDARGNYHVPLLVSPWSYSTYRGS